MKIKRRHTEAAEVSTESLNDIMFFLLLFFLIISTLANPSVLKLTLPASEGHDVVNKQQVTLEVDKDHNYVVNKTPVPFSDLETALKFELERTKVPTIVLRLDNTLAIQDLSDVMNIGYKLGAKMVLATKSTNK